MCDSVPVPKVWVLRFPGMSVEVCLRYPGQGVGLGARVYCV